MKIYAINLNNRERVESTFESDTIPPRSLQYVYLTSQEKVDGWCLRARTKRTVKTLVEAYRTAFEHMQMPADAIKASVEKMGLDDTRYALSYIVNYYSWDGRISRRNKDEAAKTETLDSGDFLYGMTIHLAHVDQLMDALRKYAET